MIRAKKRIAAVLTMEALVIGLTIPAMAVDVPPIRLSSYKGSTLDVGERSGLIIGPGGAEYTVTSSDPGIVAVEQVLTYWVAVARAEGGATITAVNHTGESGVLRVTVGPAGQTEYRS